MQRILAAIEIFALVFWVGGLFFIVAFIPAVLDRIVADDPDLAWNLNDGIIRQFAAVELIFALILLISNFLKVVVFRGLSALQRVALMISATMLIFTAAGIFVVTPRLEEKRSVLTSLRPGAADEKSESREEFNILRTQQEFLFAANWALGLFLVYAYRTFEERKLQALARIIKMPE